MKTPEDFARHLEERVYQLIRNKDLVPSDIYDPTPQPKMFPAVWWPFSWLIETIAAAQEAVNDPDLSD